MWIIRLPCEFLGFFVSFRVYLRLSGFPGTPMGFLISLGVPQFYVGSPGSMWVRWVSLEVRGGFPDSLWSLRLLYGFSKFHVGSSDTIWVSQLQTNLIRFPVDSLGSLWVLRISLGFSALPLWIPRIFYEFFGHPVGFPGSPCGSLNFMWIFRVSEALPVPVDFQGSMYIHQITSAVDSPDFLWLRRVSLGFPWFSAGFLGFLGNAPGALWIFQIIYGFS